MAALGLWPSTIVPREVIAEETNRNKLCETATKLSTTVEQGKLVDQYWDERRDRKKTTTETTQVNKVRTKSRNIHRVTCMLGTSNVEYQMRAF